MYDTIVPDSRAGGKRKPTGAHQSAHQYTHQGAPVALPYGDTLAIVIPREALDTLSHRADILASAATIVARCHWQDRTAATLARELSAHAAMLRTMQLLCVYDAGALADLVAGATSATPTDATTTGAPGGVPGGAPGGVPSARRARPHKGKGSAACA